MGVSAVVQLAVLRAGEGLLAGEVRGEDTGVLALSVIGGLEEARECGDVEREVWCGPAGGV